MTPPSPPLAVVTLLTSDSYLPGALTAINSLLDAEQYTPHAQRKFDTVCLVTPATVGHSALKALEKVFDVVVGVEQIMTESWGNLDLLGRRDLAASLTKLHVFRLTQYRKAIFLDADTLVLRPLSPLFNLPCPFAAAPDQGWPDAFNSGVMVVEPKQETFDQLIAMMKQKGTWDGGDQGLLNDFFPNWHRLSFTYNVTPSAYYTYAPAYKRHGQDVAVLHFIGNDKPWKRGARSTYVADAASKDYYDLVGQWYDVFERHFGSVLTYDVASRVIPPPASFKSTFTSLPSHLPPPSSVPAVNVAPPTPPPPPKPIPIPPSVASGRTSPPVMAWDPSRSSPPRDGALQMRDPIPSHYSNIWDDPSSRKMRQRFEPPAQYPQPPKETHDWYKEVMKAKPDPSAVKPVFPWEEPKTPSAANPPPTARRFSDDPPPAIQQPPTPQPPMNFRSTSFTNAWDSIPAISKYAESLAKKHQGNGKRRQSGSAGSGTSKSNGRRKSISGSSVSGGSSGQNTETGSSVASIAIAKAKSSPGTYPLKGDASSRDGDDEDDEDADVSTTDPDGDTDDEEADRIAIKFRQAARTGEVSPTNSRSKNVDDSPSREREGEFGSDAGTPRPRPPISPPKGRKDSRYVPTSPRQIRTPSSPRASGIATVEPGATSPSFLSVPAGTLAHSPSSPGSKPSLRVAVPGLPGTGVSPVVSPRLAAQALRNSTAARLVSSGSGHGDAPPVVRATRVFRPETDTGVVKQQGLAALQRFVESMEAEVGAQQQPPQPQAYRPPAGGGAGTAGSYRW
ncbi:hypothetical protein JCM1840_004425 [Sporobolomyces johnsonii]